MSHLPVRTKLTTSKPKPRSVSFLLTPLARGSNILILLPLSQLLSQYPSFSRSAARDQISSVKCPYAKMRSKFYGAFSCTPNGGRQFLRNRRSNRHTSIGQNPFTETIFLRKYSVYEGLFGENTRLRGLRRRRDFGQFWAIVGTFRLAGAVFA
jgi:hypothetical protein